MTWASIQQHVNRTETDLDRRARMTLNGEQQNTFSSAEDFLEHAPLEEVKKAINKVAQTDQQKADAQRSRSEMDVWIKTKPQYRDHPSNAKQLLNQCRTMFGTLTPTMQQAEEAYQALVQYDLLDINKTEDARQKDKRDAQKAQEILEAGGVHVYGQPTEAEMNEMSLEELRRRANGIF